MKHGSLACLENPQRSNLNALISLVDTCRQRSNVRIQLRALRRICSLHLLFGDVRRADAALQKAERLSMQNGSRQGIYLLAIRGELHRLKNELEEALKCHRECIETSKSRRISGWQGHGHLGAAETLRMMGHQTEAVQNLDLAEEAYRCANNQAWGLLHVLIARHLLDGTDLDAAKATASQLGYSADVVFIEKLKAKLDAQEKIYHHLLFP